LVRLALVVHYQKLSYLWLLPVVVVAVMVEAVEVLVVIGLVPPMPLKWV
jgi:hypothetical protein